MISAGLRSVGERAVPRGHRADDALDAGDGPRPVPRCGRIVFPVQAQEQSR